MFSSSSVASASVVAEERVFLRALEEIVSQAVRTYVRLTGRDERAVRAGLQLREVDPGLDWIEFSYEEDMFHFRR